MSLKVLQLCHGYKPPFDDVARQWASLFEEVDCQLTTVFLTGSKNDQVAQAIGGKVIFFNYSSQDLRGLKRNQIRRVRELHGREGYDVCIAHRYKSIYISTAVKSLKVIGVAHAFGVFNSWFRRLRVKQKKSQLLLVGVSNAVRDEIRGAVPAFPPEQVLTVYNRINLEQTLKEQESRGSARQKLGLPAGAFLFASVGRLHPDKGYDVLIRSFAIALNAIQDAYLVLIGEGRQAQELREIAAELKVEDRVIFLGFVPKASCYFKAFDVFVLSSENESFGMVLLESMAAGVPAIYSNSGGFTEVMGPLGSSFKVGDQASLAEAMVSRYSNSCDEQVAMASRVQSCFSDEAVRRDFWAEPAVKTMLKGD